MNAAVDVRPASQNNDMLAGASLGAEAEMGELAAASATHADEALLTPYQRRKIAAGKGHELTLGPYRILDELGKGSFGQVFKAEHSIMKRVVALKVIIPERANSQHWLMREVQAATRLTHPNIA